MMLMRKLENFLEDQIEGFFNKKFSSNLQIDEIESRLEKEFYLKQREQGGQIYAPDSYTIILGEADYQNFNCPASYLRLYPFLLRSAIKGNFFFEDKIVLQMALNTIKDPGCFSIQAVYQDNAVVVPDDIAPAPEADASSTIVFQKTVPKLDFIDYSQVQFARLKVIEGVDLNAVRAIGVKRIHLGRRENNEFCLQDKNCSRLHAYIAFENYRHIIYDADSLNGTCVNRQFTRRQQLRHGDQISIGNTVIIYEVD